eukprot:Gb_26640 [translate_table: standard]
MGHGGHSISIDDSHFRFAAEKMDQGFSLAPSFDATSSSSSTSNNYIEHKVSKLDTLAGVAIKYGVEVSDIKRMNGLVTDLQMFAHKTLQIPLPGRHPPSPAMSNNPKIPRSVASGLPPRQEMRPAYSNSASDSACILKPKTQKRPVSLAMNLLRGYYGLGPTEREGNEGTEMTVYKMDNDPHSDDEPFTPPRTYAVDGPQPVNRLEGTDDVPLLKEVFIADTSGNEIEKATESSVRRRSKVEGTDLLTGSSENILKQDPSYSGRVGKGPSLRPKSGSKVSSDSTCALGHPFTISDSFMADGFVGGTGALKGLGVSSGNGKDVEDLLSKVRRSSSASSLQDSGKVSPIKVASRWAAKGEIQGLSTSSVHRPVFEGLPKPLNGRRNKAALD